MNTRANIMYFIEPFLELAEKERHGTDYIRRMQRDIIRVVDAVCPEDGSGAANVKVARKVLQGLQSKGFLPEQTVNEVDECLKERTAASLADAGLSSPVNGEDISKAKDSNSGNSSRAFDNGAFKGNKGASKLEKRQIEQRIEEDRERHKKRRENMWVTPKDLDAKRAKLWDDTSDMSEDENHKAIEAEAENEDLTGTGLGQVRNRREAIGFRGQGEDNDRNKGPRRDRDPRYHDKPEKENRSLNRDNDGDIRMSLVNGVGRPNR